jgi:WhiB family redox-sensing transcriptional regulator
MFSGRDHGISRRGDDHWTNRAACIEHGPLFDLAYGFEPKGEDRKPPPAVEEAKAVCARCPVIADCLAEVLAYPTRYGVWAGLTADERTAYARKTRRHR